MLTTDEIVSELNREGYNFSKRTFNYYKQQGLIPDSGKWRKESEGGAFALYEESSLNRIREIFRMKGKGFKLSEIKTIFRDEKREKAASERKEEYLKSFIEINGHFYEILKREPDGERYKYADCLKELFTPEVRKDQQLYECGSFSDNKEDVDEIEKRGLFVTPYIFNNRLVYDKDSMYEPVVWIILRREYDIDWDTLQALCRKHAENLDKYFYWPEPDDMRFSKTWIGYQKQSELNGFGCYLKQYIANIRTGSIYDFSDMPWDFQYTNVYTFIEDFLSGNCAIVPTFCQEPYQFLKKFK